MANWLQGNLARAQNASEAYDKGAKLRFQSKKNLQDTLMRFGEMGFQGLQNRLQREHEEKMPDLNAQAEVNRTEGLNRNRYRGLFDKNNPNVMIPPPQTDPTAPADPQAPMPDKNTLRPSYEEPDSGAAPAKTTTADGTKYPNQYAQAITGSKSDWKKLKFYENGQEIDVNMAMGKGQKVRPGVIVDYSALVPSQGPTNPNAYSEFMAKNNFNPSTLEPPQPAVESIPENARIPETVTPKPRPLAKTNIGKHLSDRSWEQDVPGGWLREMEDYDTEKKIREASETERYAILRRQVAKDHPDWSRDKIDATAERLYLSYFYGQQGGGSDKDKNDEARLFNYAMSIKEMAKKEPGIMEMFNPDGTIKQGMEDMVLERTADMAARLLPPAFPTRGQWTRPEYNAIFDPINPQDPDSRVKAKDFFKDLYKNGTIPAGVAKTPEDGGGGIFSTGMNMSIVNPIVKAITASKMGDAESDKMWAQFSKENVSPFGIGAWVDKYLKDHGFKPLSPEDRKTIKERSTAGSVSF